MAKPAKQREVEITDRIASKFLKDILQRYENIESARGRYMNAARRERDAMVTIFEKMAAQGVSQKAAKANIKIVRALSRIQGWMADLEADDRNMARKLARAQQDKKQLLLWNDLPKQKKPEREPETAPKLELVASAAE